MIGIYKITNTENGKVFIGKSNNIMASWKRQTKMAQSEDEMQCQLYQELQEYGIQNFSISVLEECSRNLLDEREKYWIMTLQATDSNIGYNISSGGQKNFALKGEQHSRAKLSQQNVDEIYILLKNSDLSFSEIAKIYNISNISLTISSGFKR